MKKGVLYVVSGFSGAGKGTILKEVFSKVANLKFSVSCTSRLPRLGEVDGIHYHFKTNEEFEDLIEKDAFVEYTKTFTNYYGTLKSEVDKNIENGNDVVFDINVVGANNIKKIYPDAVLIFVTPPSINDLRKRLIGRGSETPETLERRIAESQKEIQEIKIYDYILVNDKIEDCVEKMIAIFSASKCEMHRNEDIINHLLEE